jgi:hypothetical protein
MPTVVPDQGSASACDSGFGAQRQPDDLYDQVVPGSVLMGYLNADHWAIAVPINRTHSTIAAMFVTQNAYPREALVEALLRFVEEDLDALRDTSASP